MLWILFFSFEVKAYTFSEAIRAVADHQEIKIIEQKVRSLNQESKIKGSWGDPKLKLAAKNFPKDSLKDDETPMTGIEVGLSQKISLTNRYGDLKNSVKAMAEAKEYDKQQIKRSLYLSLWQLAIEKKRIIKDEKLTKENLDWISKMLSVSKKLYSNGTIGQQALLEIKIRKSELESLIDELKLERSEVNKRLAYIYSKKAQNLDITSVPWSYLKKEQLKSLDPKELRFKKGIESKEYLIKAHKKSLLSDVTFSLAYTKRSDIDNRGDFITASISFPLPFSDEKHSKIESAVIQKDVAYRQMQNYKGQRSRDIQVLDTRISKINNTLKKLKEKTIAFAKSSRDISAKSYQVGKTSYLELLNAELKLQNLLMKKNLLEAKLQNNLVHKKYVRGDSLYE